MNNLKKGDRVWWTDPGDNLGSCWGTVVHVQGPEDDAVITLLMDGGGNEEAYPHELAPDVLGIMEHSGAEDASHWEEDEAHPVSDWKYLVDNDDTRSSYKEWVESERETAKENTNDMSKTTTKEECDHTPDWNTITIAYDGDGVYIDIECSKCRISGCVGSVPAFSRNICW